MERAIATLSACAVLAASAASSLPAQTLKGSPASVDRQYTVAMEHDYSFLESVRDVEKFIQLGLLVPIKGGPNYELADDVSFPYARPAVRTFVERLSAQYVTACGEDLVITSLTRPTDEQPRNASEQSVHPAGMAVDLRVSRSSKCRRWLEKTLLGLEKTGVLDVTREHRPSHYHVAVFPQQYLTWVQQLDSQLAANDKPAATSDARTADTKVADTKVADTKVAAGPGPANSAVSPAATGAGLAAADAPASATRTVARTRRPADNYEVNPGDTLWSIAHEHGISVTQLKRLNGLRSSRIAAGQTLRIPAN